MPLPRVRFTVRRMMVVVAVVAILLWEFVTFGLNVWKEQREQAPAVAQFMAWLDRSLAASGQVALRSGKISAPGPVGPLRSEGRFELETGAGRGITITVLIDAKPGRKTKRVAVSSASRTVEVPVGDVEDGRPADLRAIVPEAFR